MARFRAAVTAVSILFLAGAAAAQDAPDPKPGAPKVDGRQAPPKKDEPSEGTKEDGPKDAVPAVTLDDVLAGLADTKFAVKRLDAAGASRDFQDPRVTTALAKLLKDEHPDVRTAAVTALALRTDPEQRKKAADALGSRLAAVAEKTEHEVERMAVIQALHDLAQPSTIDVLLDRVGHGTSLDEVDARCRAVGNVPSPKAIEALIGFLQKRHRDGTGYRASCNKALQYATGERGTNDPDMWRAWWKEHERTFDFQAAYEARQKAAKSKDDAAARKEEARRKREEREREREKK